MWPDGEEPPWPMISSTWLRTASSEMPRLSSAFAATPFTFVDEPEQDVLGADVAVVQQPSFLLREHHDPPGPIGEAFKHDGECIGGRPAAVLLGAWLGHAAYGHFRSSGSIG